MATQGERLREILNTYNLSQIELAKRLDIPKASLSMYVSDKRKMKQNRITQLAEMFNLNEAWIMGYDVPMRKQPVQVDFMIPGITEEEHALIEMYRSLDKDSRQNVSDMINRLYLYAKKLNELQKGGGDNGKH